MSSVSRVLALALLLISVAFVTAPQGSATSYWQHYGWDPSGYDGSCVWYVTSARCSGWNNWNFVEATIYSGGPVLVGFENYQRIRGQYGYAGDYREVDPYMLGMCCYLIAHGTNTAIPAWVSLWAVSS